MPSCNIRQVLASLSLSWSLFLDYDKVDLRVLLEFVLFFTAFEEEEEDIMLVQQIFISEIFVDGTSTTLNFQQNQNFFHFLSFLWLYLSAVYYCVEKDTYIQALLQHSKIASLDFVLFRLRTFANTHSLVSLMISWITSLPIISTTIALSNALEWWSILLLLCWMFTFENALQQYYRIFEMNKEA